MTSPRSDSDSEAPSAPTGVPAAAPGSSAFEQFHPRVQQWIWNQQWQQLREAQERAAEPIVAGAHDVIIAAATASGKTEAAFLPICSALLSPPAGRTGTAATQSPDPCSGSPAGRRPAGHVPSDGVKALYVSPLKALINDQYGRLREMCESLDLPVHRWHGDVPASAKAAVVRHPDGLLLITPESLEALLIRHGSQAERLFAGLRYVVVDELHSFLGAERGAQLQSLLHRIELAVRRRVPRIGLSATLGDMAAAASFLRPGGGSGVRVIVDTGEHTELRLKLHGYESGQVSPPTPRSSAAAAPAAGAPADSDPEPVVLPTQRAIAEHLYRHLRGSDNLIFANSRADVESYADLLRRRSIRDRVPNEFVPHHGNLSKELREDVEARLKDRTRPVNAVCTSTLELGIDIGSVTSIAQIGAPYTVSSMRQRLGRSGRRGSEPSILRLYVTEERVTSKTAPQDALRVQLVQSIAMVNLLLRRWNEAPDGGGLHLSTLIQQLLSLIAQHGGVAPAQAYQALCQRGPFAGVTADLFKRLLRALGRHHVDLIIQASDGLLLLGAAGERLVEHYSFYAAFRTGIEYRLVANGQTLGSLPIDSALMPGSLLIFGGRRWQVLSVDSHARVIDLARSSGGKPPVFAGSGGEIADQVRQEMYAVYTSTEVPAYLDESAARLLHEGRTMFDQFHLATDPLLGWGADTLVFPWCGDRVMTTLALALTSTGCETAQDGVCLTVAKMDRAGTLERLQSLRDSPAPDPVELAARVATKVVEKHDEYLSEDLLNEACAARSLDVPAAWAALKDLVDRSEPVARLRAPADRRVVAPPGPTRTAVIGADGAATAAATHTVTGTVTASAPRLGMTPFAVVDVETTGVSPTLGDRVVEIAVVRISPDGVIRDSWDTLLNPGRDMGASRVHGLRPTDVLAAPAFRDIADELARRLDGHIVAAHNAPFDLDFLSAEYARLGSRRPDWPALCTLRLSRRFGAAGGGSLEACLAAEHLTNGAAHTALGDAAATASLLTIYLRRAREARVTSLAGLGCVPDRWPVERSGTDVRQP